MTKERIGEYQQSLWLRRQAEESARRNNLVVPLVIQDKALATGIRWAILALVILFVARFVDGIAGINILTSVDVTKLYNYYVPSPDAHVLTPQMVDDSTFIVEMPVKYVCCKVDIVIPKNRCIFLKEITPINVSLPNATARNGPVLQFKVGKYGGYAKTNPDGSPFYTSMSELLREPHDMNPDAIYGAPMIILDSLSHFAPERVRFKSWSRQYLYVGVNIHENNLSGARGFYRMIFGLTKGCPPSASRGH